MTSKNKTQWYTENGFWIILGLGIFILYLRNNHGVIEPEAIIAGVVMLGLYAVLSHKEISKDEEPPNWGL